MTAASHDRRGSEEGAVAVEAALTLSVLLLLILGIIQFAIAIWQGHTMIVAVSHAGRYVEIKTQQFQPAVTCSALKTEAVNRMQTVVPHATVSASETAGDCTGGMKLTASFNPGLVSVISAITVSPSICVPMQKTCT